MGAITISNFGGIVPRTSERLLADNAAKVAANCRLSNGELVPLRSPKSIYESSKAAPLLSIYRMHEDGAYAWLTWPDDVDVVKAPFYGPGRWCFSGDGEPRITTIADSVSGGGATFPNLFYTLGTPKPVTAPTVTPSATGSGSTVDRYYAYTFYASWDGLELEGAVSPLTDLIAGKTDDTWAVTGMDATPPNSGTVSGVHASGTTTFTDTVPTFLRTGEQVVIGGDTLEVTVTSGTVFTVPGDYSAATAWARKAPFPGTIYKRLYRSAGTAAQFQLVAEGITGTTYNDTLTDGQILGDELISADWDMPPVGLRGMFLLPSGAVGGFVGNKVVFSEPYQPHAYPADYAITVDYPVIGAESFGTGVAVATTSAPTIINGVEPGQMVATAWKEVFPCLSKRSVVSVGDEVLYASASGMISVNSAGVSIWSLPYFTDIEFSTLAPETMVSAKVKGKLVVLYNNGVSRALMFNVRGDTHYLTESHFDATELHVDETTGALYFADGSEIFEHDPATGYNVQQEWWSKEISLPRPMNLGAAKVSFIQSIDPAQAAAIAAEIALVEAANALLLASGDVHGAWDDQAYDELAYDDSDLQVAPEVPPSNEVSFQLYIGSPTGEAELVHSDTVTDSLPFSLSSGYKAESVSVRVVSQCHIKYVELGGTKKELASA